MASESTPVSTTPGSSETILLVDDDPTNLRVLYQTLQGRSYKLLIARSGEQALSMARRSQPAVILLDIMMPGLDGFETCRQLKTDPATRETTVIFLSALDQTQDKVRGLELGAVDYITKPFQADEIIARVNTHLTIHRLRYDLARRNQELYAANQELHVVNERMRRDLEAAARLQQALLPSAPPATARAQFAWVYRPCDALAGDALNVFAIDARFICVYVLEVSNRGVPAALLAVTITRHLLLHTDRSCLVTAPSDTPEGYTIVSPAEVARRLNTIFPMQANGMHSFTLLYGILDTHTNQFRFVSAGHPGPIRVRSPEPATVFDVPACPIGTTEDAQYEDTVLDLQPGDRLYLYSDGLYEGTNAANEAFGRDRVHTTLTHTRTLLLDKSLDTLIQAVVAWRGSAELGDDVSIIAVEIHAG